MTAIELGAFCARVRRLFGGEMDEELWRLTRERLAGLRAKPCEAALDDYALAHGGSRARFIPGKFFEFYGRRVVEHDDQARRTVQRETAVAREVGGELEAQAVAEDWRSVRERVERLEPARRAAIIRALVERGWTPPAAEPIAWGRSWLLAVSDIAEGRTVPTLNRETGVRDIQTPALEFWGSLGRAAETPVGASAPRSARNPTGAEERLPEARRAVSGDPEGITPLSAALDEIPF